VRRIAETIDGYPGGTLGGVANVPMTAHILGGCVIGATPDEGVEDPTTASSGTRGCTSSTAQRCRRTSVSTRH